MLHPAGSTLDIQRIAAGAAAAADPDGAFDHLIGALSAALETRACLFQRAESSWVLVSQSRGGMGVPMTELLSVLDAVPSGRGGTTPQLVMVGGRAWTSMAIDTADALKAPDASGGAARLVLAGDWSHLDALSTLGLMLPLALGTVRAHEQRRRAEGVLVDSYAIGRRLSRGGGLDVACQRIVQQISHSLRAERVTLALHRPEENRVAIAAVSGQSPPEIQGMRIEPGAWVMGHVYASRRPVVVRDVRQLPGMPRPGAKYRTFSFAAVPILAGGETIGVLAATDKTDGTEFGPQDVLALRSFGASAALALKVALGEAEAHRLAHAATVDALTGLFNRPYLDERLHQEFERARRGSSSLTLLLADIDDFKTVNDTSGHQVGDAVLQAAASVLRSAVRVFDVCARYGGDEFAILMPSSDQSSAAACAERIRRRVAEFGPGDDGRTTLPPVTMSVGVAVIEAGDTPADLMRRADECLYRAKADGKNCVRMSTPPALLRRVMFIEPHTHKS